MATLEAGAEEIRDVNARYHDAAADSYDGKWAIDFGEVGQRQVVGKLGKALGATPRTALGETLEIGAGTGYFTLNLLQLGLIDRATATDISPGMLDMLAANAAELGLSLQTVVSGAEQLPFAEESFDFVLGHAVLHHIPDLQRALAEFARVLRPGGTIAFCGEPSRYGDVLAALPKRLALLAAPVWRRAIGADAQGGVSNDGDGSFLMEAAVDVHAFTPRQLRSLFATAGFEGVRVRGEELVANLYGWTVRTLESTAEPDQVPMVWRSLAFRTYLTLQRLDAALLEPRLPAQLFYNLVISARKPASSTST